MQMWHVQFRKKMGKNDIEKVSIGRLNMNLYNRDIDVSVIVPVYNTEETLLCRCIESIKKQSIKSFELLLIDDGSNERCAKMCDLFCGANVRVYHQSNLGVSLTRKRGIELAHGKYIGFVDADDWIEETFFEEMVNFAIEKDCDIVVSGFIRETMNGAEKVSNEKKYRIMSSNEALNCMLDRKIFVWSMWDKIYKADLLKGNDVLYRQVCMGEDLYFLYKCIREAKSIGFIPLYKYHYVYNPDSITRIKNPKKKLDSIEIFEDLLKITTDKKLLYKLRLLYIKEMLSCLYGFMRFGKTSNEMVHINSLRDKILVHLKKVSFFDLHIKSLIASIVFLFSNRILGYIFRCLLLVRK